MIYLLIGLVIGFITQAISLRSNQRVSFMEYALTIILWPVVVIWWLFVFVVFIYISIAAKSRN
jgi:hypothetical protein